jgi:D-alanine transaminase
MAKTEAKAQGADDAWLVGTDGYVTEGASSNAWIVTREGEIVTRPLSNMILAGVTRRSLMDALAQAGLRLSERAFSLSEARRAAEAFTTAATGLVTPVVAIDGVVLSDGRPQPVTRRLQALYYTAIGADVRSVAPWLAS